MIHLLITITALLALAVADNLSGTAFYQRKDIPMSLFNADQFDVFDTDDDPSDDMIAAILPDGFRLMSDEEMERLADDVDVIDDSDQDWYLEAIYSDPMEWEDEDWSNYAPANASFYD